MPSAWIASTAGQSSCASGRISGIAAEVKEQRCGREADAFRDFRATGIRTRGFRSCARQRLGFRLVAERWATFDCYGTIVDWNAGIRGELEKLFGVEHADRLLARYHELEPEIQAANPGHSYREVLTIALERLAGDAGLTLPEGEASSLAHSLPSWPVFDDAPEALTETQSRGWRLAILSNTDRDLIDASIEAIGVRFY